VQRVSAAFDSACETPLDLTDPTLNIAYHRQNEHYRAAHFWAGLLLRRLALQQLFADAASPDIHTFLLDMNALFERFVSRLLEEALAGTPLRVHRQRANHSLLYDARRQRPHASVRPDLLVERPTSDEWYPIDAKYKLYDEKALSAGDLYQTFLYAHAYKGWGLTAPGALILYPATTSDQGFQIDVRDRMKTTVARIEGVPIDVRAALDRIRQGEAGASLRDLAARLIG
jgi:5-methylcytosine-specific restriction enzyme subunit McrC